MRFRISTCMAGMALLAAFAAAPVRLTSQSVRLAYQINSLPTLGGVTAAGSGINNRGWIAGTADEGGDNISHAAVWVGSQIMGLGALGGSSRNSAIQWLIKINNGVIVGISN